MSDQEDYINEIVDFWAYQEELDNKELLRTVAETYGIKQHQALDVLGLQEFGPLY